MANVKPKTKPFCVNLNPGKHSYITLVNPDNTFTSSTKIGTVQDTEPTHQFEWTGKVSKWKPSEIRVRLKALARTKFKGGKISVPPPPDGGTLTVTISMPVKPVDPVPVDYVDDDETP